MHFLSGNIDGGSVVVDMYKRMVPAVILERTERRENQDEF